MPASERTAITTFMPWRTFHSVVVTKARSNGGCLTWTARNSSPATTAHRPAARVSLVGVMVMTDSWFEVLGEVPRGCLEGRQQEGDPASPNDVTDWVICCYGS